MPTHTERMGVRQVHRLQLEPRARKVLGRRQVAWLSGMTLGSLAIVWMESTVRALPELSLGILGVAAAAAFPRQVVRVIWMTTLAVTVALILGPFLHEQSSLSMLLDPTSSPQATDLHVAQVVVACFSIGALLPLLDRRSITPERAIQSGLALSASAGVGLWTAQVLLLHTGPPALQATLAGAVTGIVTAQTLLVLALHPVTRDRIPGRTRIAEALDDRYRGLALQAWQLDQDLARICPDSESRDDLGEVAAWVFRLQCTRQTLAKESAQTDSDSLAQRIANLSQQAVDTEDAFTRDRLLATVQHLRRLQGHHTKLEAEHHRAAALTEFAIAFMEEARAELTLACVKPGDVGPERLQEVLLRLRTYASDRNLARQTRRELATVKG